MRRVITTQDVPEAGELKVPIGTLVTPSARDLAGSRGVKITELPEDQLPGLAPAEKTIAMGADHGGFRLKEQLKPMLEREGLEYATWACTTRSQRIIRTSRSRWRNW